MIAAAESAHRGGRLDPLDAMLLVAPEMAAPVQQAGAVVPAPVPVPDLVADSQPVVGRAMPPEPVYPSPLPGVTRDQWLAFCGVMARESPGYASQRHVGRYRQRRERVAEIGQDATMLLAMPELQDDAFATDMANALHHLRESGVLARWVGQPIAVPDVDDLVAVTASGLLAVCATAGLEGCVQWLGSKIDRARFRHTTNYFLRCNGMF